MTKPYKEKIKLKDYEGFTVKNNEIFIFKCCDCGLEHFVNIYSEKGINGVAMARVKQHRRRFKQRLKFKMRKGKSKGKGKILKVSTSLKPLHKHTRHLGKGKAVK